MSAPVLQLRRELHGRPQPVDGAQLTIRAATPDDLAIWLQLRSVAVAQLQPRPGEWTVEDARREIFPSEVRQTARTWLAMAAKTTENDNPGGEILAGSVTLLVGRAGCSVTARVHWLLVEPRFRRRGIARFLMATLERACWDAGIRRISLETHRNWTAAVAFYRSLGYEPM
jgi:GNAT superfamily N-acetyltransferase